VVNQSWRRDSAFAFDDVLIRLARHPFTPRSIGCIVCHSRVPGTCIETTHTPVVFTTLISLFRLLARDMTFSADTSAKSSPQKLTPASSPPPAAMEKDNNEEGVLDAMQQEEQRMRIQREKNDAKREAQLEKERQEDINSGKDILDKKFQQLEFLMNKSKVSTL
jgi:hypothetical protein